MAENPSRRSRSSRPCRAFFIRISSESRGVRFAYITDVTRPVASEGLKPGERDWARLGRRSTQVSAGRRRAKGGASIFIYQSLTNLRSLPHPSTHSNGRVISSGSPPECKPMRTMDTLAPAFSTAPVFLPHLGIGLLCSLVFILKLRNRPPAAAAPVRPEPEPSLRDRS